MGLNTIKGTGNWGGAASDLNNNFASITAEIEKLKAANVKFKGYYTTKLTLKAAHPSPTVGDNAWVGAEYPGVVYRCNVAGTWLATTDVPSVSSVNLSEYYKLSDVLDKLKLNVSTAQTLTNIGEMAWNPETETVELKISNEVTMSIGQELFVKAKNTETTSILNGTPVYISGAQGGLKQIKKASNLTDIAEKTIGIATQDIAASASGIITTMGEVHGLNTSAFAEGALIWLGANGTLTTTKPVDAPYHIIIGVCTRSHATEGSIFVSVKESYRAQIDQLRSDLSEKANKTDLKYLVLSYNTDVATTRKLVLSEYRCSGLIISYNTGSKWITELYTGTLFTDTDWASNSNWKTVGETSTIEGLNLYEIQTPDGSVLMSFDENGKLYSNYVPDSIPVEAVKGLESNLNSLNEVSLITESSSNILEVKDNLGNVFASINEDGTFDIPRLRVNNLDFYGEQFEDTSFIKDRSVVFPELKFFKINIEGELAWDTFSLTSVNNVATFYTADNKALAKFRTKQSIQGASSAGGHLKKGYTLDLYNDQWKSVELKIGNMIASDSYHTKGFWGDCTHTRDVGNGHFYWEIAKTRTYPNNLVRNVITTIPTEFNGKTSAVEDAIFASNGRPFAMYHNGVFFGLYTFRLKKTKLNYALDSGNKNHIFIDSWAAGVALGSQSYADFDEIATKYEIRSPKKITTDVRTNVERLFNYMRDIFNGTKDFVTTYQDYMILEAWIDWKIQAEIIGHWDSVTNNAAYITYDGLRWYPVMVDTDNTLGLNAYSSPVITSTRTFVDKDIWVKFNTAFLPQIKARYKELRDKGIISDASAKKIFGGISENIPYYIYEQDFAKWGSWSGSPIIMDSLYTFYHNRMNYLDSIWID